MVQLTAEEVAHHPEYKNVIWNLPPTQSGKVEVAKARGGPIKIAYEIHGHGDTKLVWIMGLGTFKSSWQRQTKYFCHDEPRSSEYQSLIFDNRGMAESDKPSMRYTTSEMAKDALELIDSIGWIGKRQLHIVGVSMGGMIAQELALMVPERIASVMFLSTAARLRNTIGFWEHLRSRINLFIPRHIDIMLDGFKQRLFAEEWLEAPDQDGNFPTNGDRMAAQEVHKRSDKDGFTRKGFILQAIAANWHYKSPEQLKEIADKIGRERIMIVHGTKDSMITFPHAETLSEEMGKEVEFKVFEGKGHALIVEERDAFNHLVEELVNRTKGLPVDKFGEHI